MMTNPMATESPYAWQHKANRVLLKVMLVGGLIGAVILIALCTGLYRELRSSHGTANTPAELPWFDRSSQDLQFVGPATWYWMPGMHGKGVLIVSGTVTPASRESFLKRHRLETYEDWKLEGKSESLRKTVNADPAIATFAGESIEYSGAYRAGRNIHLYYRPSDQRFTLEVSD